MDTEEEKNKKILLYRIDEQSKNVIFVATVNNESVWGNIADDKRTIISFDDIFRDITEFRRSFLDYEKLTDELIGAINGNRDIFYRLIEKFNEYVRESMNFFTRYYSEILHDTFFSEREYIGNTTPFANSFALKKATGRINSVFGGIKEVMRDDWNFDFNSESNLQTLRITCTKIIIRGNDRNEVYTQADTVLLNFFYDFSFAIHKLKLYSCDCRYCGKKFLGMKNAVVCNAECCQTAYERDVRNAKRRAKDNATYQKYKTKLSNYIGQQKIKLPAVILGAPELVEKFDLQRKVFTNQMQNKLDEYEAENRLPDKELEDFYEKMKQDIMSFVYTLEAK